MDKDLAHAAMLAWDAALTVRGRYGAALANSALERSARQHLRHLSSATNHHLARLATDAARASSMVIAIQRADGRKADVVSIA
jgi:hypothetical protein